MQCMQFFNVHGFTLNKSYRVIVLEKYLKLTFPLKLKNPFKHCYHNIYIPLANKRIYLNVLFVIIKEI